VPVAPALRAGRGTDTYIPARRPRLGREGVSRIVRARGTEIGIPDLRPHDLRRTLAGVLDARGVPVQDIRLVLRHHYVNTTQTYLADNSLRVHDRMSNFIIG
jgi:integrase